MAPKKLWRPPPQDWTQTAGTPLPTTARYPLALMVVYFVGTMLTIANYVAYIRFNRLSFSKPILDAYLSFTVIGTVAYAFVSGTMWLWAARYALTEDERTIRVAWGLFTIAITHDCPCFTLELYMLLCCPWKRNPLQYVVFSVQTVTFFVSFTASWILYMWVGAAYLESRSDVSPQVIAILRADAERRKERARRLRKGGAGAAGADGLSDKERKAAEEAAVRRQRMAILSPAEAVADSDSMLQEAAMERVGDLDLAPVTAPTVGRSAVASGGGGHAASIVEPTAAPAPFVQTRSMAPITPAGSRDNSDHDLDD